MNNLLLKSNDKVSLPAQAALGFVLLTLLLVGAPVSAEPVIEEIAYDDVAADAPVEPIEPLSAEELEDLVGPIALYPDDLIAIVLPASTYPLQIVQAVRFLAARKDDKSLEPSEDWDDSVVALLNYPEVLELMNDDLDWTWKLGEAVLIQQKQVIAAVSNFRERARVAGNLESDEHQIVEVIDDGSIEIRPADPEVIYVPYYEPARVTVYHEYPVYHYYPRRYPVYYYPYPSGYAFSSGFFWGVTSAFSIGWSTHHLHLHHYDYRGHPYYGRRYYDSHLYRRPHLRLSRDYYYSHVDHNRRPLSRHHAGNYWQPGSDRYGASPRHRSRYSRPLERRDRDRSDSYRPKDRHQLERKHADGRMGGGIDGERFRQRQQLVQVQRPGRPGQFDGKQRTVRNPARSAAAVPVRKGRVIAKGTNHRNGLPEARMSRETRKRISAPQRATLAIAQQPRVQRPARQQARVGLPQSRPEQARIKRSGSKQDRILQSRPQRPEQQSQSGQRAATPKQGRGAHRSNRGPNERGVVARSFRSQR